MKLQRYQASRRELLSLAFALPIPALFGSQGSDISRESLRRSEWVIKDPRMTKSVTLVQPQVCLGELLQILTAQTGVSLLLSDMFVSAETLTVLVTETPLIDIVIGLQSLLSLRPMLWRWEASGSEAEKTWSFVCSGDARMATARLRRRFDDALVEQMEAFVRLASASPEEREAAAKKSPYLEPIRYEDTCLQAQALASLLPSPRQREAMIRNRETHDFLRRQWNDAASKIALQQLAKFQKMNPHREVPEPEIIRIGYNRLRGQVAPLLNWLVGNEKFMLGGSAAGGIQLEAEVRARLWKDWLLDGDLRTDPDREAKPARGKSGAEQRAPALPPGINPIDWMQLEAFHRGTGLPILARADELPDLLPSTGLEDVQNARLPIPAEAAAEIAAERSKVRTIRQALDANPSFMAKWRGPCLLLLSPDALWRDEGARLSWELRRWIRATFGPPALEPSFATWCELARRTTTAQDQMLSDWLLPLWSVEPWPALPRLLSPELCERLSRQEPVPWSNLPVEAQDLLRARWPQIQKRRASEVRLVVTTPKDDPTRRHYSFTLQLADGAVIGPIALLQSTPVRALP